MSEVQILRNVFHDCLADIKRSKPNEEEITAWVERIPNDIEGLALQWGWNDTEVREKIYMWIDRIHLE
ncbi:hypothetical protein Q0V21_30530 [Paenibacillus sp. 11B]|uniref:hypothetical protein n=1 Tax=Paenibacillus sp. 11B TaxID=3060965 RepID=UPI00264EFDAA|nr:hypothetical protein [Paenibacillus sp. 11B]MDN8593067.1 hypothetical protein [Paenibacillus sp. 11B]